jgi:hypothetical protein
LCKMCKSIYLSLRLPLYKSIAVSECLSHRLFT